MPWNQIHHIGHIGGGGILGTAVGALVTWGLHNREELADFVLALFKKKVGAAKAKKLEDAIATVEQAAAAAKQEVKAAVVQQATVDQKIAAPKV